ncbi:MAG: Gfo/Idh/MocA family oxidoreductase, partial [Acidimicrobiia bacterium]|nr:Gfo/Idh/MocA family oxidoreductase [Acidimicrobiia bacterium]
ARAETYEALSQGFRWDLPATLNMARQALDDRADRDPDRLAVLDLSGGAAATVDLSRNCRYGDDVRTEVLGENGAIFVDLLPAGRTRLATAAGVEVIAGSETADPFAAGIRAQAEAFARAVRGEPIEVPGAAASRQAIVIGRAVQRAAATGKPVYL